MPLIIFAAMVFRRNAIAFRAIEIGFGNVRSFDTKSAPRISRKSFDLELPNFMGTSIRKFDTTIPDMTSLSASIGSKTYKHVTFGSCSGRDCSITVQPILKRFTVFETDSRASFPLVQAIKHFFAPRPRKWKLQMLAASKFN